LTHVPIHVRELFLFMLVASEASVLSNNSVNALSSVVM